MTENQKNASHVSEGEGDPATEAARSSRRNDAPFHGVPHSEHPHDPFRNDFGGSGLKFEF